MSKAGSKDRGNGAAIRVSGVTKDYHDGERVLHVLRGADLTVQRGEIVAIVGQSGSGKSTLLHLLGALDRPTKGRIEIEGEDLAALGGPALDRLRLEKIGFVFQFHHLMPGLKAWENVAMPALVARRSDTGSKAAAIDLLESVGMGERLNHRPAKLSGGEQQRVALARALMNDPHLILADEPTGNLDEEMSRQVIDLLWNVTREHGRSLVIVTHETFIAEKADRVLRLHEGRLRPA
ncbi:ABC transporter ATP-binding protein [Candidatus Sumerlaeota bacterium]|nr:ABC transporter ATP-binding protein [Candidatus Sumerlaeota bacterium]